MAKPDTPLRVGIDTGGTFTDLAYVEGGKLHVDKLSSTPTDPAQAVLAVLARLDMAPVDVVHGSTVGLNAVLTGNGLAKTAFVTNDGLVDLIEIGRQDRQDLYDLWASKAQLSQTPRQLRFGIQSRRDVHGAVLQRPTKKALAELVSQIRKRSPEALAIGLLHAAQFPDDEAEVATALQKLRLPTTCSAALLPRAGEHERFVAAILNASITPLMSGYLGRLVEGIDGTLRMLRNDGGIMDGDEAR